MAVELEGDFGALGLADTVLLEALGGIGPVDVVEAFDELVGVGGDAQDPLADRATFDRMVTAVRARAFRGVQDFLVRKDGAEGRAGQNQTGFSETKARPWRKSLRNIHCVQRK